MQNSRLNPTIQPRLGAHRILTVPWYIRRRTRPYKACVNSHVPCRKSTLLRCSTVGSGRSCTACARWCATTGCTTWPLSSTLRDPGACSTTQRQATSGAGRMSVKSAAQDAFSRPYCFTRQSGTLQLRPLPLGS